MYDKAKWSGGQSRRIAQRLVVEGELELLTPAQFGSGEADDVTDMPLLVDAQDGVTPLLTGSTLAGALRAYLYSREQGNRAANQAAKGTLTEKLFGGFKGDDEGVQSALIVDDAFSTNFGVELRDGVRLDPRTRTAVDQALFDMQVWSAGTTFPIRLELQLAEPKRKKDESDESFEKRAKDCRDELKKALFAALQGLTDGGITLGGRKNRGYGRFEVTNWRLKTYNMRQTVDLMSWLEHGDQTLPTSNPLYQLLSLHHHFADLRNSLPDARSLFRLEATFRLDGSLLIRANGRSGSDSPDMVHLHNHKEQPVLPGTSVAGALRQRARRILHLVQPDSADARLTGLFGDEEMRGEFHASRLIVEEHLIKEPQFDLVQNRVAIDRFTGGAYESALFNERPVFGKDETRLQVNLTVREPEAHDIGLLLLLLKDLWTGDLPLGGEVSVGRGRLAGVCAKLTRQAGQGKQVWKIEAVGKDGRLQMDAQVAEELEQFVAALYAEKEQKDGA